MNNHKFIFIIIVSIFLVTRFLGLGHIYHQDEYRWASIANPAFGELASSHPPITQLSLSLLGGLFGYENLRVIPLIYSIFNLFFVYLIALKLSAGSKKIAYIAASLFAINVYSLISNLQVDIDGAILPFFILLSYYSYLKLIKDGDRRFLLLLLLAVVGGFLAKLSFALFTGALAVDYLFRIYEHKGIGWNARKILLLALGAIILFSGLFVFFISKQPIIIEYAQHFKVFNFGSRAYFDLLFKLFKSLIWLSPLLILPFLKGLFKKDIWIKYRFWFIYIVFNLLFYLIIFDFTRLTIERYFMFLILPLIFVSADILSSILPKFDKQYLTFSIIGFILLVVIIFFIDQSVIPLNPKSAYMDKVRSLNFNFLIPTTGGSGPIGFYISAQFILWTWIVCIFSIFLARKKKICIYLFLIFSLGYNTLLASEYLFGSLYGSVNKVTKNSLDYIINNDEIKEVITYYDAGAYYLKLNNKYHSRFYTAPTRDYTKKLTEYRSHYMVVDFPAIDKDSAYWRLISRCDLDKKLKDRYVDSYIFDCTSLSVSGISSQL